MKRFVSFVALMAIALSLASSAEACNRCGHHGAACKFKQEKQHAAQANQQIQINFVGVPVPAVYGQIAQQGNTVWGYGTGQYSGLAAFAESYGGRVDNAVLANLANKLVDRVGVVTSDLSAVISQETAGQAEVARILAKGQAASQALAAADAPPTAAATQQRVQFEITSHAGGGFTMRPLDTASGPSPLEPPVQTHDVEEPVKPNVVKPTRDGAEGLAGVLRRRCNSCHAKEKAKDLTGLSDWSVEDIDAVIDRLESADETKRMPRGGPALVRSERQEFYLARSEAEARQWADRKGALYRPTVE